MSIWLVMQTTDGLQRQFAVKKPQTVIGRETTCDVRIPVPAVSQKHCRITMDGPDLRIVDLDSSAGTFHNGERVKEARLLHEDRVTIGPVTFIIRVHDDAVISDDHQIVQEVTIVRHDAPAADRLNLEG